MNEKMQGCKDTVEAETGRRAPCWTISESQDAIWPCPEHVTREEAIAAGRKAYGRGFYVGRAEWWWPHVEGLFMLEELENQAWIVDTDGQWLSDVKAGDPRVDDLQKRLQGAVDAWLQENDLQPTFFTVTDVEYVEVQR